MRRRHKQTTSAPTSPSPLAGAPQRQASSVLYLLLSPPSQAFSETPRPVPRGRSHPQLTPTSMTAQPLPKTSPPLAGRRAVALPPPSWKGGSHCVPCHHLTTLQEGPGARSQRTPTPFRAVETVCARYCSNAHEVQSQRADNTPSGLAPQARVPQPDAQANCITHPRRAQSPATFHRLLRKNAPHRSSGQDLPAGTLGLPTRLRQFSNFVDLLAIFTNLRLHVPISADSMPGCIAQFYPRPTAVLRAERHNHL